MSLHTELTAALKAARQALAAKKTPKTLQVTVDAAVASVAKILQDAVDAKLSQAVETVETVETVERKMTKTAICERFRKLISERGWKTGRGGIIIGEYENRPFKGNEYWAKFDAAIENANNATDDQTAKDCLKQWADKSLEYLTAADSNIDDEPEPVKAEPIAIGDHFAYKCAGGVVKVIAIDETLPANHCRYTLENVKTGRPLPKLRAKASLKVRVASKAPKAPEVAPADNMSGKIVSAEGTSETFSMSVTNEHKDVKADIAESENGEVGKAAVKARTKKAKRAHMPSKVKARIENATEGWTKAVAQSS